MRRMILELSPELLAQMLTSGTGMVEVVANPLPADARIVDARLSFGGINLQLVIESETFREVAPGSHLGYLPAPVFKRKPNTVSLAEVIGELYTPRDDPRPKHGYTRG